MTKDLEALLIELMLEEPNSSSVQERFLSFLVMEPFIRQFRAQGLSNKKILELCRSLDARKKNDED